VPALPAQERLRAALLHLEVAHPALAVDQEVAAVALVDQEEEEDNEQKRNDELAKKHSTGAHNVELQCSRSNCFRV